MKGNPKFDLPGIPQHVVIRGAGLDHCFTCSDDYEFFLHCLKQSSAAFKCQLHAYILMPDHVYMVVTPEVEFGISNMMQALMRRYARYTSKTYQYTEPLWEKRYKSSLIDSRNYLFACMCHVEASPVRAKIVDAPSEYRWSSYHANVYNEDVEMIRHHKMYTELGDDNESRCQAYLGMFSSGAEAGSVHAIRNALYQELVLGSNEFKEHIDHMIKIRERMRRTEKFIMKKQAA